MKTSAEDQVKVYKIAARIADDGLPPEFVAKSVALAIESGGPHCLDHGRGLVSECSALGLAASVSDPVDAVHLRRRAFSAEGGAGGDP